MDAALDHDADDALEPGTVIAGRYRVGERLGAGAIGTVYFAEHITVQRPVAVKVLARRWLGNHPMVERFRSEARAASAAGHPNIVDVFDAGDLDNGLPFIVMEHLAGRELWDLVQDSRGMDLERMARIARDVARALAAAHERGIVHRDLKAENVIIVERDGIEAVKVLDFGVAHMGAGDARRTSPGMIIGTPEYMAPEQVRGAKPTPAIDIYALGVLMHEMLTGSTPFHAEEPIDLLAMKSAGPAPSIATRRADLPPRVVELVDECLDMSPEARPTAAVVARRLHALLERGAPFLSAPHPVTSRPRRTPWLFVALLGGAGTLLTLAFLPSAPRAGAATPSPPRHASTAASIVEPPPDRSPEPEAGSTGPEPEPVEVAPAEPEPEPAPPREPKPAASRSPAPLPKPEPATTPAPEPKPRAKSPESLECRETRERAQDAREVQDWSGLLRYTRASSCWDPPAERKRLRVKALLELGRHADCIAAGGKSEDRDIVKWVALCERRAAAGK